MSLDDWRALGEDASQRYELQEGVLMMAAQPRPRHQRVVRDLIVQIAPQTPPGRELLNDVDVVIDDRFPPTVRVPDLVICHDGIDDDGDVTAADILVAVEILSPGTRRVDLVMKRSEYADAGIVHYWIVDPDELTLEALHLVDGAYVGEHVTGTFTTTTPFPLTIDLDGLH